MKLLKWIWELVHGLAGVATQSGYIEVLPDDKEKHREEYFEGVRKELEMLEENK